MNLFLHEIKAGRKQLIIWCIGIVFIVAGGMSKYGGIASSGGSMAALIAKMPKSLQAIMGTGALDLSSPMGYYGVVFSYLLLMAAIHAIMLGAEIIAKEETDKTAEFLIAKPISRGRILTCKLLAAILQILLFNLAAFLSSMITVSHYRHEGVIGKQMIILAGGMFILQLIFLFLGSGIAAAGHNPKRSAPIGTALLLTLFLLSIFIDLNSKMEVLKYLTPFKYFEAKRVLADGRINPVFMAISAGIISALLAATYRFYQKRDMNA